MSVAICQLPIRQFCLFRKKSICLFQVGIVITDGRSTNASHTALEADKTRSKGIHLFAVGVGNRIDIRELYAIASRPRQDYAFRVRSFAALDSIKELLAIQTCTGVRQKFKGFKQISFSFVNQAV